MKIETGGNNNGTIVQWLVKLIIYQEQLDLIFFLLCINVQSIAYIQNNPIKKLSKGLDDI